MNEMMKGRFRNAIAMSMLNRGLQQEEIYSPLGGLNKILSGALGGYMADKFMDKPFGGGLALSDERLKHDIEPASGRDAIAQIMAMRLRRR